MTLFSYFPTECVRFSVFIYTFAMRISYFKVK